MTQDEILQELLRIRGNAPAMPPMDVDPNDGVPRPNAMLGPEQDRMAEIQAALASSRAPKQKKGFWMDLLEGTAEGLAYGDRAPAIRQQRGQLDRQKQMDLAAEAQQIQQGVHQRQQGQFQTEAANRAGAQEQREAKLFPAQQRTAEAQATAAERTATAQAPRKYGQRDVEREGKKFREYFDEQEPGVATDTIEIGPVELPEADYEWVLRNSQPLQIKKGTAQAGDSPYSRPEPQGNGPRPDYEWVVRNGQPLQITKGAAQPGDKPYDAVAARSSDAGSTQSPYSKERTSRTLTDIEDARKLIGWSTTGMGAETLAALGGTDARQLAGKLKTLTSNIKLNELAQMKETSRTGASGLGALSDREGMMLEYALGAVDQGLQGAALIEELDKIKGSIERWQKAKEQAASTGKTGPSEALIKANMAANPGMTRDQVIQELSK